MYPVKSLPGIRVEKAIAGVKGLKGDRRYMLCDRNGKFISLRQHTELYHFDVVLDETLRITHHSKDHGLALPIEPGGGRDIPVEIWGDQVNAIEPSADASLWFSDILKRKCHMVYMPDQANRKIGKQWQTGNDDVSFADGYSYLLVGSGSLEEIGKISGLGADPRRFRPNLVFSDTSPYEEFYWNTFSVGKAKFQGLKPCERCQVTTIDPDTMDVSREPLLSLSKQKVDNKIVFGQHASVMESAEIQVGDDLEVHSIKETPYEML
jgi:uncharacterized protein YcbX